MMMFCNLFIKRPSYITCSHNAQNLTSAYFVQKYTHMHAHAYILPYQVLFSLCRINKTANDK